MRPPYPPHVQTELAELQEHSETVALWARSPIAKAENLRVQLGELRFQKASAEANASPVEHFTTEAQRLEAEIEALVSEHRRRRELSISADIAATTCRDWLARLPDSTSLDQAPAVKLGNGDSRKLLDIIRRDIAEQREQMGKLRARPQERAEIADQVGREVARRAGTAPRFHPARGISEAHPVSLFGLICALFPAEVCAHLTDSYVASYGQGLESIGSRERAAALAGAEAKLLALGRQEEALVEQLLELGPAVISRRRDADPAAILGVTVRPAKPKTLPARPPAEPELGNLVSAVSAET